VSSDNSITVIWPPLAVGEAGWRSRLESIATQAEALVGRKVVSMQASAELALELFGLIWPAFGPETVAASARASLLLNMPVVMASTPADQLQEIAERLDSIYEQAQSDPAAAVVTVPAPLLQRVQEPQSRPGRKRAEPDPEPADPLELEPEPEPEATAAPEALPELPTPTPPPPSWLSCGEVAELLSITRATVATWRRDGRLGVSGVDYVKHGRSTYFAPAVVEQLETGKIPAGLDQLLAEVQAP
jgi:hypothetical protein